MPEVTAPDFRILLFGAGGFVGSHLRCQLARQFGNRARIVATSRAQEGGGIEPLDLTDTEAVRAVIQREQPTHAVNLAGIASPPEARAKPALAWEVHACAPERLGRILLEERPECWLFHVGSGLAYGRSAIDGRAVGESSILAPMDPYGVTKAAGDIAMGALADDGLKCVRLRPFNHTSPGQTKDFVVPAFTAQLARIRAGSQKPVLRVGDLSAIRDFLDVRDVVAAYATLIAQSDRLAPGAIFNVASGVGVSMENALRELVELSGMEVKIEPDPARQRQSDLPVIVGNAQAMRDFSGWAPRYSLTETLSDMLGRCSTQIEVS